MAMRSHEQIITDIGGPAAIGKIVGAEANAAKQWRRSNSIPARYWKALVDAGKASWEELGTGAANRQASGPISTQDAAA